MHLIFVRNDLTGYQHLHPQLQPRGRFTVDLTLPEAGLYRAVADIKTGGKQYTLTTNVHVPGLLPPVPSVP